MAAEAVLGGGVQQIFEQLRGTENDKGQEESSTIEPKEFFWDQFLKYISTAIVALSVFHVSVALLHGGGVVCFPPSDTRYLRIERPEENTSYAFSRSQSDYVNSYCSRSVPLSEYFPIYLLVHGLLLIAPHYVWGALFKGDFDSFYAIAERFDRLRDSKTGEYDPKNFDRVQKLELEYGGINRTIFQSYIVKLVLQVLACVGSIVFSQTFFIDFSFSFNCPKNLTEEDIPPDWPLNTSVLCVFTTLRVLNLVRYADYILIGAAILLILWGLLWCIIRHTVQLGSVEIANFAFQSCLAPDSFVFPHILSWPKCPCFSKRRCTCRYPRISLHNLISPRIKNDLDFLLMCLFRADSSHGKVFKDIQINKELKRLIGRDHQLLHLYVNVQQDMASKGEIPDDEEEELTEEDLADGSSDVLDDKTIGCCERLCQMFRRVQRSRIHSANQQESMQDDEDTTCSCCGWLRQMCQRAFSTHRTRRPPLKRQSTKYGAISDFKDYFRDAGFTTNPEHHAYHYFKPYLGNTEWHPVQGIRDRLYGFVQFCPKILDQYTKRMRPNTYMAIDLSFGSVGYALVLARPFRVVVSMNFHPFYRNDKEVVKKEEFYTNYITVKFPVNIFAQNQPNLNKASEEMINFIVTMKRKHNQNIPPINFIVVGPISEEAKRITVNLAINLLQTAELIEEGAILLAIRPLRVGHKKVTQRFFKYEPAKQQFDELPDAREKLEKEVGLKWVDGVPGVRVQCGNIPCVFEFVTYKYKSHNRLQPTNTPSMPLEEPDVGVAFAQPNNGDGTTGSGDLTEAPLDLSHPDTRRFIEVMGKLPRPLRSRQHGTRPPTRFIPLDNGSPPSPRQPVFCSDSTATPDTAFNPTLRPQDLKNGRPKVLHFGSHTSSIVTTTTATLTNSTSPVHTPVDTKETMPTMQTMPTIESQVITATNGSIQSTEDALPSMRDPTLSDPESSQTDQLPNNDAVALQLDADASRPKPKRLLQGDDLSPTNSLGPALNAQHYTSSGTSPLRMRKKADKNTPATPQGATQPSNTHNYRFNDRESQSQMNLDVNDFLELLPTSGAVADNSSILHDNDAAVTLTAINGHTVDNKALDEEGSTEV